LQTNEDKLVRTLDNANTTIQRIGTVFSDENQRNLATTLKNVSAGSKNLEVVMRDADDLLRDSRITIKHFSDSLGQADQVLTNLQIATKPLADRSDSVMRNLDESTVRLNKALTELDELFRSINQGDGALHHFIRDPTLYNNLNEAAFMLTRSLPRIDRILHDFEVFADKIARHPESLGVGGAIRPSAGLKEAPTTSHWRGPDH
jgi:phospholipid/cholesterol/gamma-HCH transport system substrate-binding protein